MRRWLPLLMALLFALPAGAAPGDGPAPPVEVGKRVALVVGVSSYEKLPPELQVDSSRTEATRVAAALEQGAGFDQVRLLTDASATLSNLRSVLEEQVSKEVQWRDLFLFYFVGQGLGGDFGEPRLLLYDTDPEQLEATSIAVKDLASLMQKFVPAARFVVVTDAARDGALNGLALLGPSGNDWPPLGNQSFIISSAAPRQVSQPGVFSKAFIEAVSGGGDTNADGMVTGSELNGFLVLAVPNATAGKQLPTVNSKYNPGIEITRRRGAGAGATVVNLPLLRLDKVKFVFPANSTPKVQCTGMIEPRNCDGGCYLFDIQAGDCQVAMTVDGKELAAATKVEQRGAYRCGVFDGAVQCTPPVVQ
jgi:hypothetical protein